jgi:hypothetical protein
MQKLLIVVFLFAASLTVSAQAAITKYDQQVFAPGVSPVTGSPQWTNSYVASLAVCGQTLVVGTGSVVNPTKIAFDDPNAAGKVCIITLASALLTALPNGVGYTSTLTQTDNLGQTSARSAASNPFDKQGVPGVLTGLRVVP